MSEPARHEDFLDQLADHNRRLTALERSPQLGQSSFGPSPGVLRYIGDGRSTTLSAPAAVGDSSFVVADPSFISAGDKLRVGASIREVVTVLSKAGSTITITGKLAYAHASGDKVQKPITQLFWGALAAGDTGLLVYRQDGRLAMAVFNGFGDGDDQVVALYDQSGNQVVVDDVNSDQGLARPWLPAAFVKDSGLEVTTTSGSFVSLWHHTLKKQLPKLEVNMFARAGAGTTGEVRIYDETTATEIAIVSLNAGAFVDIDVTGPIPGTHLSEHYIKLQARRTSGADVIGIQFRSAWQRQS